MSIVRFIGLFYRFLSTHPIEEKDEIYPEYINKMPVGSDDLCRYSIILPPGLIRGLESNPGQGNDASKYVKTMKTRNRQDEGVRGV
jgi:hypothetical protein